MGNKNWANTISCGVPFLFEFAKNFFAVDTGGKSRYNENRMVLHKTTKECLPMQLHEAGIREVLSHFDLPGQFKAYQPIHYGHINDTVRVDLQNGDTADAYIVQRINTHVFQKPDELMENVVNVTAFLAQAIRQRGGDVSRETLTVFRTKGGKPYYTAPDGDCIRVYNFVRDTYALQAIENADDYRRAGEAFGNFQNMLADFPVEKKLGPYYNDIVGLFAFKTGKNCRGGGTTILSLSLKRCSDPKKFRKKFGETLI